MVLLRYFNPVGAHPSGACAGGVGRPRGECMAGRWQGSAARHRQQAAWRHLLPAVVVPGATCGLLTETFLTSLSKGAALITVPTGCPTGYNPLWPHWLSLLSLIVPLAALQAASASTK